MEVYWNAGCDCIKYDQCVSKMGRDSVRRKEEKNNHDRDLCSTIVLVLDSRNLNNNTKQLISRTSDYLHRVYYLNFV